MIRPTATALRASIVTTVLAVTTLGIVSLAAPSSEAAPGANCTYYSNGSYTTVVGQFGYDCCNNRVAWGRKSSFAVCGGCFVCFPPPR